MRTQTRTCSLGGGSLWPPVAHPLAYPGTDRGSGITWEALGHPSAPLRPHSELGPGQSPTPHRTSDPWPPHADTSSVFHAEPHDPHPPSIPGKGGPCPAVQKSIFPSSVSGPPHTAEAAPRARADLGFSGQRPRPLSAARGLSASLQPVAHVPGAERLASRPGSDAQAPSTLELGRGGGPGDPGESDLGNLLEMLGRHSGAAQPVSMSPELGTSTSVVTGGGPPRHQACPGASPLPGAVYTPHN